jgi:hypothetical protein
MGTNVGRGECVEVLKELRQLLDAWGRRMHLGGEGFDEAVRLPLGATLRWMPNGKEGNNSLVRQCDEFYRQLVKLNGSSCDFHGGFVVVGILGRLEGVGCPGSALGRLGLLVYRRAILKGAGPLERPQGFVFVGRRS